MAPLMEKYSKIFLADYLVLTVLLMDKIEEYQMVVEAAAVPMVIAQEPAVKQE
tara:strand:- start:199 stop:357 length:159 start_codon:yes stop_codon:yes gene_type:complete